jgi:hypothetical protein
MVKTWSAVFADKGQAWGILQARLTQHRFTRRKKELVDFDASESGMTAYFCARYENQKGQHGVWGAVVSAIIP